MQDVESQAAVAADTWSVEATPFLEPDVAAEIEERFRGRADVIAFRVAGGRRLLPAAEPSAAAAPAPGEGRRSRFVLMHPDLGLDAATAEAEHCRVLRVDDVDVAASSAFPNALLSIGVDLDRVGDVVVDAEDASTVHLVVDPTVAKRCMRLLPKELVGVGIKVSLCGDTEFMPHGAIQDMKPSKILMRQLSRKTEEYVTFG